MLELDSGETIAESNAILLHLAEGTPYLPTDQLARTRVHEWLFFEQNRIEAELAYARFLHLSGRDKEMPEVYENRKTRGRDAVAALDRGLIRRPRVRGGRRLLESPTSPCTPTCTAPTTPRSTSVSTRTIEAWLERVEAQPGFVNDLEPLPAHALSRPV